MKIKGKARLLVNPYKKDESSHTISDVENSASGLKNNNISDILLISDESRAALNLLRHMDKSSLGNNDGMDELRKCIIIATRIINGDKVPLKDERFLAEKQAEMYFRAILLRKRKEDSEEHDSVLHGNEDEDLKESKHEGSEPFGINSEYSPIDSIEDQ